jgi:hypothetical protein
VRKANIEKPNPLPEQFRAEVDQMRHDTMHVIHTAKEVPAAEAAALNERSEALRKKLEKSLQSKP